MSIINGILNNAKMLMTPPTKSNDGDKFQNIENAVADSIGGKKYKGKKHHAYAMHSSKKHHSAMHSSKKHHSMHHYPKKQFMWRFIITNGVVKKLKVAKKHGGDSIPLNISTNPKQFLLLQENPTAALKKGGYCGCNKSASAVSSASAAPDANGNLLTQAALMGGMSKKMQDYKKRLEKMPVDKLKKIAGNKNIKITKKKNGVTTYLKKSSIIKKLCDCKK